jgi:hypothetical protein
MSGDAMVDELRRVMTSAALAASHCRALDDNVGAGGNMLSVYNLATFGGNCGLITAAEVMDWRAVSQWQKGLPEVMERWNGREVLQRTEGMDPTAATAV